MSFKYYNKTTKLFVKETFNNIQEKKCENHNESESNLKIVK